MQYVVKRLWQVFILYVLYYPLYFLFTLHGFFFKSNASSPPPRIDLSIRRDIVPEGYTSTGLDLQRLTHGRSQSRFSKLETILEEDGSRDHSNVNSRSNSVTSPTTVNPYCVENLLTIDEYGDNYRLPSETFTVGGHGVSNLSGDQSRREFSSVPTYDEFKITARLAVVSNNASKPEFPLGAWGNCNSHELSSHPNLQGLFEPMNDNDSGITSNCSTPISGDFHLEAGKSNPVDYNHNKDPQASQSPATTTDGDTLSRHSSKGNLYSDLDVTVEGLPKAEAASNLFFSTVAQSVLGVSDYTGDNEKPMPLIGRRDHTGHSANGESLPLISPCGSGSL